MLQHSPASKIVLAIKSFTLVPANVAAKNYAEVFKSVLQPIPGLKNPRTIPKVVAAICGHDVHIAVGFPSDEHSYIADKVFSAVLGTNWREQIPLKDLGGGSLRLDWAAETVEVSGESFSLGNRAVPNAAIPLVQAEVKKYLKLHNES